MLPRTTAARTIETGASRPMSRCCSRAEITLTAIPTNTAPTIAGLVYCPRIRETSSAPPKTTVPQERSFLGASFGSVHIKQLTPATTAKIASKVRGSLSSWLLQARDEGQNATMQAAMTAERRVTPSDRAATKARGTHMAAKRALATGTCGNPKQKAQ